MFVLYIPWSRPRTELASLYIAVQGVVDSFFSLTWGCSEGLDVEKLRGNFVEAHTLPIRAECSVKEQSWNILYDSPASVI